MFKKVLFVLIVITLLSPLACTSDFSRGEQFFKEGKYHSSVEMFFSYIREHPKGKKVSEALYKMGYITYQYIGETEQSLRYFKELVNNYPVDKYTLLAQQSIAEIYKDKLQDCEKAIVEFQKLIDWDPESENSPHFLYQIASCYKHRRNYPQALVEFESILKKYPQSKEVGNTLYQIGLIHYINENYEKALKYYGMVINQYPDSQHVLEAKFGMASCYEEMENFDKALEVYNSILDKHPSRKVVEIRIAGIKERKKKLNR